MNIPKSGSVRPNAFLKKTARFGLSALITIDLLALQKGNLIPHGNMTGSETGLSNNAGIEEIIRTSVFQVVSIITPTGYATVNYDLWPTFCKALIILITISGACSSSTGGGVKVIRIMTAVKYVRKGFAQKLHPNRVINLTINKKKVPQQVATDIVYFIFLYIAVLVIGTILISFDGFDITTNFTAALTCLSNVGPGLNLVGPSMNFSGFSDFSTFVLSILMIAGRLELFTFVMLFSPHFWNSNRV